MAEIKDKIVTAESLSVLHDYVNDIKSNMQTQLDNKHTIGNNVVVDKPNSPHLALNIDGKEATKIYKNANETADYGTHINDYDSNGERDAFIVRREIGLENKLCLKVQNENGEDDVYYIYGEHNKPTASEIGALPTVGGTVTGGVTFNGNVTFNGGRVQTENIYLSENGENKGVILAKNPSGNYVNNLQLCNEDGNCIIGYGNFERKNGDTRIYGNNIYVDSVNSDFMVDGIQLAHVDEATCTLTSNWAQYASGGKTYVNRYGKVVTLTGALKNTVDISSSSTKIKMFAIPSGYRPAHDVTFVCHGVGVMTWLLTISSDGSAYFSRHGASAFTNVDANEGWFTFSATYIAK